MLRRRQDGGLGAVALAIALLAIAAAGFVVLFSNDYVKIEGAVTDLNTGVDPWTANVQVRVTNLYGQPLVVERFTMTVWANAERTVPLTTAEIRGVVVDPHMARLVVIPITLANQDAFGGKVWVDVDAMWMHGDQHYHESVVGKEISVGAAMASLS